MNLLYAQRVILIAQTVSFVSFENKTTFNEVVFSLFLHIVNLSLLAKIFCLDLLNQLLLSLEERLH